MNQVDVVLHEQKHFLSPLLDRSLTELDLYGTDVGKASREIRSEVVVALHPHLLVGLPVRTTAMSRAMVKDADIIAMDTLGRVHIFEFKQGKARTQALEQATVYLHELVLKARKEVFDARQADVDESVREAEIARAIASLLSNENLTKVGFRYYDRHRTDLEAAIYGELGRGVATKYQYDNHLTRVDKCRMLVHLALHAQTDHIAEGIGPQAVLSAAKGMAGASPLLRPLERFPMATPPLVLWVGGHTLGDREKLEKQCRKLRALGVDARPFTLSVAPRLRGGVLAGWEVTVGLPSHAVALGPVEQEAVAALQGLVDPDAAKVELEFFHKATPSQKRSEECGNLLDKPQFTVKGQ